MRCQDKRHVILQLFKLVTDLLRSTPHARTQKVKPNLNRSWNLILLFWVIVLSSCKEQVSDFFFDPSKISEHTTFIYHYDANRVMSQVSIFHMLMSGLVVDSMVTRTEFVYNNKGQLIREEEKTEISEEPTITEYHYAANDSLISEMTIRPEGDTSYWAVYEYFPDGRRMIFNRSLILHVEPEQDLGDIDFSKYDTIQERNEFDYVGNECQVQREFDLQNNLIRTITFEYRNIELMKETHFTYLEDKKMIEKTKFYDYSKSSIKPDSYALDHRSDTIEVTRNEFKNGLLSSLIEAYDYGASVIKTFFEGDKEIGKISYDRQMKSKYVTLHEYYENGKLRETKSYLEELNK